MNNVPNYINQPIYVDEMFKHESKMDNVVSSLNTRRSNYIYFKKNCENWSDIRIHLFNSVAGEYTAWADDPYMEYMGNDLYRFLLPSDSNLNKVVFRCDIDDYKTTDSYIPIGDMYEQPIYYQSSIGHDGIWGDYTSNTFKLFIKLNNQYDVTDNKKVANIIIKGDDFNNKYTLVDVSTNRLNIVHVPLKNDSFTITVEEYKNSNDNVVESVSKTINLDKICYNFPHINIFMNGLERVIDIDNNSYGNNYSFYTKYNVYSSRAMNSLYWDIKNNNDIALMELGDIDDSVAVYSEDDDTHTINGKYQLCGDYCIISASVSTITGAKDVYYYLPVACVSNASTVVMGESQSYYITTDVSNNDSILHVTPLNKDEEFLSDESIDFTLTYKYK